MQVICYSEMAKLVSFDRRHSLRFVWKIETAKLDVNDYSQVFSMLELRWQLYNHSSSNELRDIHFYKIDSEKSFTPFYATSFIDTPEQKFAFPQAVEIRTENERYIKIWKYPDSLTAKAAASLSGVVKFVVLCTPINADGAEHKSIQTSFEMDHLSCLESLSTDFSNLLDGGTNPDVMLKCGEHATPAHRLVLSSRSEVFSAMFCNDMLESRTGSVDIVDLDQPVLHQLLQYIYTGKLRHLTADSAQSLYTAGDKYAVHELKSKCRAFLMENLNEEVVCDLLVFSDVHSDQILKNAATELFVKNAVLLEDGAWFKFCDNHPRLALEVYRVYTASISKSSKNTPAS